MKHRSLLLTLGSAALAAPWLASCSAPAEDNSGDDTGTMTGGQTSGGSAGLGGTATGGTGGGTTGGQGGASAGSGTQGGGGGVTSAGASGAAGAVAGAAGTGFAGNAGAGGSGAAGGGAAGAGAGAGGASAGAGGSGTAGGGMGGKGAAGAAGSAGGAGKGGAGGAGGGGPVTPLDCGPKGTAIENAGPPSNRVNYLIAGDGYTQAQLDTTYMTHLQTAMTKRFSAVIGQVYGRYRKFVNICALKIPSTGAICSGTSHYNCCGNDSSRLATCTNGNATLNTDITQNLPASFEVDWRAIVLNGSSWWNTGSALMLWSGGNADAAGAALHEGGHGFHALADEYTGTDTNCTTEFGEIDSTAGPRDATNPKWGLWVGYNASTSTGMQGFFQGSRYCPTTGGQYRPSSNSMMNSLFGTNVNTSFNSVSREKMIMDIWRIVASPYDSVTPPAGAVTNPPTLTVNVIDPAVISVDWSIDGSVVAANGGPTLNVASRALSAGSHTVTARAYDNADDTLVRYRAHTTFNRQYWGPTTTARPNGHSEKTVSWTVTIN